MLEWREVWWKRLDGQDVAVGTDVLLSDIFDPYGLVADESYWMRGLLSSYAKSDACALWLNIVKYGCGHILPLIVNHNASEYSF